MAISTNPKPTIYRILYENTGPDTANLRHTTGLSRKCNGLFFGPKHESLKKNLDTRRNPDDLQN